MFTDDPKVDSGASTSAKFSEDGRINGADAFVAMVKPLLTDVETIHHGHMGELKILGEDEATVVWAMQDWLYLGPPQKKGNPQGGHDGGMGLLFRTLTPRWR